MKVEVDSLYERAILRIEQLERELREAEAYIRDIDDDKAELQDELKVALRIRPAAPSDEKDLDFDA